MYYIFHVLPGSMFLRIVDLSCLAIFYCYSFCLWHVIRFKYIIFLLYYIFEFVVFSFCFPVEGGLFHDGSAYLGYCILCSFTVVCSAHSHGLYHHSCCLSCCLGYGFSDICLLSCHLLSYYFLPCFV